MLVLRADEREVRLGGAAAVAMLLRGLGADVTLASVVGDDSDGRVLRRLLDEERIGAELVLTDAGRPTTVKERFLGRAANRQPHQALRVDSETRQPIGTGLEKRLVDGVGRGIGDCGVVLISDYAKGVCTPGLLTAVLGTEHGVPTIVDPARFADFERYCGATVIVPNRVEAELAWGSAIKSPADGLVAGQWLCDRYGFTVAMVKLDADGIAVVGPAIHEHVPTRPRGVCDVTGAGDMVLVVVGLCQAAGWGLLETAELANVAAGLEVEKSGVAPGGWDEIRMATPHLVLERIRRTCWSRAERMWKSRGASEVRRRR